MVVDVTTETERHAFIPQFLTHGSIISQRAPRELESAKRFRYIPSVWIVDLSFTLRQSSLCQHVSVLKIPYYLAKKTKLPKPSQIIVNLDSIVPESGVTNQGMRD